MVESWKRLHDYLKGDPGSLTMCTIGMLFASEAPIYLFTLLDYLALPSLYKYRLHYAPDAAGHLGSRTYPPWEVVKNVAKVAEFNFFFAYVIPGALMIHLASKLKIFVYDTERELTWRRLLKETFMISVVADIMFYWQHRLLHIGSLYQMFHKKHHGPKLSFALVHHFMTYKEALAFALPQAVPPLILWGLTGKRMHVASMWMAFTFTQLAAILGHAGWKVPWPAWVPFLKPAYHDFHHVDFDCNFGAIYEFTDLVFGTLRKAPIATLHHIEDSLKKKPHDYAEAAKEALNWPRFP